MLAFLLLAVACRRPAPDDTDTADPAPGPATFDRRLLPDARPNLLLPYDVDLDPAGGRAWVTSLVSPTVAEVDTTTGELVHVYELEGMGESELPQVAVDGLGVAWVENGDELYRVTSGGDHARVVTRVPSVHTLVGLPGGGVVVAGRDGDVARVAAIDPDGVEVGDRLLDVGVTASALADGGASVALATRDADGATAIVVVDATTLTDLRTCPAPIQAENLVQAEDGRFFLASVAQIAMSKCDDERVVVRTVGNELKNVVVTDRTVYALDRIGDETGNGANWGLARQFDLELGERGLFPTGRNSGYGGFDPASGLLWMNSEGTTEIWGMSPEGGPPAMRVRVGLHVEELARDPSEPAVVWFTGRLSGTIGRLDLATGELIDTSVDGWPIAPLLHEGELYVVELFTTRVLVYDPSTLELSRTLDPGLGENAAIQLGDLVFDAGRLFLARADANEVVELDPHSGEILGRWGLAGEPLGEKTSRLELAATAGGLVAFRSRDGTLTLLDPDEADPVASNALSTDEALTVDDALLPIALYATQEGAIYAHGFAFGADLARRPELDLDITRVLGEHDGLLLAWRADPGEAVWVDADGAEVGSTAFEDAGMDGGLLFAPDWDERLIGAFPDDARVVAVPLAR